MRFVIIAALAVAPLAAQQYPDATILTKQAAEAVLKLHSLQSKDDVTMETAFAGQNIKMTTETTRVMLNPGKTRFETHAQGLTMIIVSDGETTWTYTSMGNEYTKKSAGMGPEGVMAAMGLGNMMPNLADMHLTQKTVGEETITIDGQKHDCWVVQTDIGAMDIPGAMGGKLTGGKLTSWIDKKLLLDLQTDATMNVSVAGGVSTETHVETVKKDLQIDGPIADATFAFTPPDGAKQVDKLSLFAGLGSTPEMEGQAAADFTVKSSRESSTASPI